MTPPTNLPPPTHPSYGPYDYPTPHHPTSAPAPSPTPNTIYDHPSLPHQRNQQTIAATINSLLTPGDNMAKDPRNTSFTQPDPHIDYQRVLPGRPMDIHNNAYNSNPNSNILPQNPNALKAAPTPQPNNPLDFANHQPHTLRPAANPSVQPPNSGPRIKHPSGLVSFVAAPFVEPQPRGPGMPPPRPLTKPRDDPSTFVLVRYQSLAIAPHQGPPQVEAAARTLHAMGLSMSSAMPKGTLPLGSAPDGSGHPQSHPISSAQPPPIPASMHQRMSGPLISANANGGVSAPVPLSSYPQRSAPIAPSVPGRYAMVPPPCQTTFDPATAQRDAVAARPSAVVQRGQRPEFTPHPTDARDQHASQMFGQTGVPGNNRHQLQQQLHLQHMRQMQHYQHRQPNQQFAVNPQSNAMQQTQPVPQQFQYPVQQGTAQRRSMRPPNAQNGLGGIGGTVQHNGGGAHVPQSTGFERGLRGPALPPPAPPPLPPGTTATAPDKTATNKQGRNRGVGVHRPDGSVRATPATKGSSATQGFSGAPSSPENNGSSSNGSAQREHACTYPGCNKTFDRRYNLTVHYRRHTDEMPYPCKVEGCPQKFKWRSSQSHHMKTRHQLGGVKMTASGRGVTGRVMGNRGGGQQGGSSNGRVVRYPRAQSANETVAVGVVQGVVHTGTVRPAADEADEGKGGKRLFSPKKRARTMRRSNSTNR